MRLRVGCIGWQQQDIEVPERPGDILASDAVCMLDVPTNKTRTAFTKLVDHWLAEQWMRERQFVHPSQRYTTARPANAFTCFSATALDHCRRRISTAG